MIRLAHSLVVSIGACDGVYALETPCLRCPRLVFGGTRTRMDVRDDMEARLVDWAPGKGRVHSGFLRRMHRVLRETALEDEVRALCRPPVLAGYSLGATTALLLALYFEERGVAVDSVHTFGCPPLCDRTFASTYAARRIRTHRHTLRGDPVVRIPFLEHLGTEHTHRVAPRVWRTHHLTSYEFAVRAS